MVNSLKLYADNLLCMDLCWWSGREAMQLLGEQVCVASCTPVKCRYTPVKCRYTPVKCRYTPVKYRYTPVKYRYTPVKCRYTPVKCKYTPVKHTSVELQKYFGMPLILMVGCSAMVELYNVFVQLRLLIRSSLVPRPLPNFL